MAGPATSPGRIALAGVGVLMAGSHAGIGLPGVGRGPVIAGSLGVLGAGMGAGMIVIVAAVALVERGRARSRRQAGARG